MSIKFAVVLIECIFGNDKQEKENLVVVFSKLLDIIIVCNAKLAT